ncbi:MAG: hypothetical protein EG828_09490 [Deltaproteobacteria bacterium]|nr:hypothetical protein [Deltaproteobacteria bacterium]
MDQINTFGVRWAPFSVFCVYAVAAKVFDAYLIYQWLDMPTHYLGGIAITYFFLTAIKNSERFIGSIPRIIQFLLAVGLTAITAVVWEFLEYLSDHLLATHINLGVKDTLCDLFLGLLGSITTIAYATNKVRVASKRRIPGT